jgi:hypothetical protein
MKQRGSLSNIAWRFVKSVAWILLFTNLGSLAGLLDTELTKDRQGFEHLLFSIPGPAIASLLALASWKFRSIDIYWKAPVVAALATASGTLLHSFVLDLVPYGLSTEYRESFAIFNLAFIFAVDVVAIFAFVIRAMIARSGLWAAIFFVVVGTVLPLLVIGDDEMPISVGEYVILMGLCAFAFRALPTRAAAPEIQTLVVETR